MCTTKHFTCIISFFLTTTLWGNGVAKNSYVYYALLVLSFLYWVIFLSVLMLVPFCLNFYSWYVSSQERLRYLYSFFLFLFLPVYFSRWTCFMLCFQKNLVRIFVRVSFIRKFTGNNHIFIIRVQVYLLYLALVPAAVQVPNKYLLSEKK